MKDKADKGTMSVQEAGRRGGESTLRKYGPKFYEEIGRKGGQASGQRRGKSCRGDACIAANEFRVT